jgi:hypothetical protein
MKSHASLVLACTVILATAVASLSSPAQAAPDTSLKDVMKKMQAQVLNGDPKPLAPMIDATKAKAKPEFSNWGAIADKGKAAAAAGDLEQVKATCKECHDAYRTDYKTKYGSKAP